MDTELLKIRLRNNGLKATPRRLSILEAIIELNNHPAADEIIKYLRNRNLRISTATVYKALDILAAKKAIVRIETGTNIIRYDAILLPHHHLFGTESTIIKDYEDEDLNKILRKYFRKNKIRDFEIEDIKLQITGKFINNKK